MHEFIDQNNLVLGYCTGA